MHKEKVVIAMSGGVDSSVCASLMSKQGYECIGMTMRLWKGAEAETQECSNQSCCGAESVEDARLVAEALQIPFYAINFRQEFWDQVVRVFAEEYFAGRTPSPCILCNEKLKFDTLYKKAIEIGASKVCTGHYARIIFDENNDRWKLLRGIDRNKDQSYFLFSLTQEQLSKTIFPVGNFTKEKIREMATEENLITAKKPESMDICFIPNGDYAQFLEKYFPEMASEAKGVVKHADGRILGEHRGIHSVTIGQRKGLGLAFGEPLYVSEIDAEKNEVTLGTKKDLEKTEFIVSKVNWISHDPLPGENFHLTVKVRSRGPENKATIYPLEGKKARVILDQPQIAITPGQAAVFYNGEEVFGGGWIE